MTRTGKRATELARLLTVAGLRPSIEPPPRRPSAGDLGEPLFDVYRALGGQSREPALRPGRWDLAFEGGLVVELDEELHFNRYRQLTLEAPWASGLPWLEDYGRYCAEHEPKCVVAGRWGRRWTNPSAARMFSGGEPGDLSVFGGAPRWKQRALYDAIKDAAPALGITPLCRVSTHDVVEDWTLDEVLGAGAPVDPGSVLRLVEQRTARPRAGGPSESDWI